MDTLNTEETRSVQSLVKEISSKFGSRPEDRMGIRSGFSSLDMMTRGFHPGKLYVGAARPGAGKTSFCSSITANIMLPRTDSVLFISTEATVEEVVIQTLEAYCQGVPMYPNGRCSTPDEIEKLRAGLFDIGRQMELNYLHITHQKRLNAGLLEQQIVEHCDGRLGGGSALVIIDQASRIQRTDKEKHGYAIATEHLLNTLEEMADRQQVPILLMTQLNRATEMQSSASLANLKHSGAFEEFAHAVLLLERAPGHGQLEHGTNRMCHDATIHVAKNRHGRVGPIAAHFFGECHTWREADTMGRYNPRIGGQ